MADLESRSIWGNPDIRRSDITHEQWSEICRVARGWFRNQYDFEMEENIKGCCIVIS